MRLSWTSIDSGSWHGIRSGYCVTYQTRDSNQNNIQENNFQLTTMITSLKPYTRYYVQVAAKTGAGCGAQDKTSYVTPEDGENNVRHL